MPIAYSCPNCGKQFSVADQYAGQTGPCAGCGKPVTVPMASFGASGAYPPPPKPAGSGAGATIAVIIASVVVVLFLCGGVLIALLLPAVQAARSAARRVQSQNNMKQIAIAMHMYHDTYNALPPAVVTDAAGKPLYSGRVLLLPFLEQDALYQSFDKTKAWNDPANMAITQTIVPTFVDPAGQPGRPGATDYLFVTGANTAFESGKWLKFSDITDGTSNTVAVVEVRGSGVNWAEPRDLDLSQPMPLPPGNHPQGNNAAMLDGSVRFLSKNMPPDQVRAIATRNGNEIINQ